MIVKLLLSFFLLLTTFAGGEPCLKEHKQFNLAKQFFESRQFLLSAVHFSAVSIAGCDSALTDKARYCFALAMAELGEMDSAIDTLKGLSGSSFDIQSKRYLAFVDPSFAKSLAESDRQRISLWQNRNDELIFKNTVDKSNVSDVDKIKLVKMQHLMALAPSKSAVVAGVASALIPGLGQAYVGSWQSAGIALVLNALFLATTIEFARHDMWAATAASGLVLSVTYVGNILNAVSAADTINRAQRDPYDQQIKALLFPEFAP